MRCYRDVVFMIVVEAFARVVGLEFGGVVVVNFGAI